MAEISNLENSDSFFGHNSAADCPIYVTFCTGKQNSMAIEFM